uniref:Rec21/ENK19 domain-containing protein n=1 Tax=Oryctolagus cuniculus TaxID=9986 RepID=A0A5F9CUV8_RABIT
MWVQGPKHLGHLPLLSQATQSPAANTKKTTPPTWGQIKKLILEVEKLVEQQQQPGTATTLFLAMLAIVNSASACT